MIIERNAQLFLVEGNEKRVVKKTNVKVSGENPTIADLKTAGFALLFNNEKYVKESEEVLTVPGNTFTDETPVSENRFLTYNLYVTAK